MFSGILCTIMHCIFKIKHTIDPQLKIYYKKYSYVLTTLHRQHNTDNVYRLKEFVRDYY